MTANVAKTLAEAAGTDQYEITPEVPYTKEDLKWRDEKARSTIEMNEPSFRPTIINTFLESYDFTGKKIVPFATSGGSSTEDIRP